MLILLHSLHGITVFVGAFSNPCEGQTKGGIQISRTQGLPGSGPCLVGCGGLAEAEGTHARSCSHWPQAQSCLHEFQHG